MQKVTTFLTFESRGMEAVKFYTSIFKDSKINSSMVLPGTDQLLHASFSLDGQEFMAMDGGDYFKMKEGISLYVDCKDQAEVDFFWEKLSEGGSSGQCGWLKDQFGVSWQVIPRALGGLMSDPNPAKAQSVREAMLKMNKIKVDELQAAYDRA